MLRSLVFVPLTVLALTSCAPIYTLSPAVQESARRYSDVMDDFADQALLANVLRAKDYAPMNFNDLSSITGALSVSGTAGFTVPFGPFIGNQHVPDTSGSVGTFRNTFSPSVTGSSSPVINIGTLNTQGFMMTMIQPVSTTYILSKWDSYPHELLLYLFVKSIRFPDEKDAPSPCAQQDNAPPAYACEQRKVHRNDPDSSDFGDFQRLVQSLVAADAEGGDVDLKSLMILDPLGDPVPMGQTVQATTPVPTTGAPSALPTMAPETNEASAYLGTVTDSVLSRARQNYYVQLTYVKADGEETLPSAEEAIVVEANHLLTVRPPPKLGRAYIGYNIYASSTSGRERSVSMDLSHKGRSI